MTQVQVEQKSCQMPPQDGFTVAHFLTVADIERSARFYETVFGGRIVTPAAVIVHQISMHRNITPLRVTR
jgi:predicted enzyme related to lactoylglutathione lyase